MSFSSTDTTIIQVLANTTSNIYCLCQNTTLLLYRNNRFTLYSVVLTVIGYIHYFTTMYTRNFSTIQCLDFSLLHNQNIVNIQHSSFIGIPQLLIDAISSFISFLPFFLLLPIAIYEHNHLAIENTTLLKHPI